MSITGAPSPAADDRDANTEPHSSTPKSIPQPPDDLAWVSPAPER